MDISRCRLYLERVFKDACREDDPGFLQPLGELGRHPGRLEPSQHTSTDVDAELFEDKYVLHRYHVAGHAGNFRDVGYATRTVAHASDLHHQGYRRCDLLPQRFLGKIKVGHQGHGFQAGHGIAGSVGVNRGQRSIMPRVHRLQHVESFLATHLADDYPVRPHTQGVDDQFALPYRAFPLHVRRTAFQANHVFLLQLEFGRIFDGDDAFGVAYVPAQYIQQRRLSGACTAGNEDVEFGPHGGLQGLKNRSGDGAIGQYLLGPDGDFAKTANRQNRAVHRPRGDDDVDARSVGQARVAHGRGFVYASADLGYDLVNNVAKVSVVLKNDVGFLQSAGALDIYLSVGVHQDVVDGGILEQRLQRS